MNFLEPKKELYGLPFVSDSLNGMPYRPLGRSGLRVPLVGLGTWKIGFPETGDGARVNEKTAHAIFDRALELGVAFWDTANRYNESSGNSERVIGRWMKSNPDERRNVLIATKVFGLMDGRSPNHCRLSRTNILDSVYACLKRLQTDYIDLLYFHGFEDATPVEESLSAVEDLVARDLVRYFGVSNFTLDQMSRYVDAGKNFSPRCRVAAIQNKFNIIQGESPDRAGVLKYAEEGGISFVAYGPLARGLLTERYLDAAKVGPGDRLFDEGAWGKRPDSGMMEKIRKLAALAAEWGMSLAQLSLAYMLAIPGMGPAIPSASSTEQLACNAKAATTKLSEEQKTLIRKILSAD